MKRYLKLTLAYDGTAYNGWQSQPQPGVNTIQDKVEESLSKLLNHQIKVTSSGRTDAGVHARGQVINFETDNSIPNSRISIALNSLLPPDIVAINCETVGESFHARYSAQKKKYRYSVLNSEMPSPFYRNYSYHYPKKLNKDLMIKGTEQFIGKHDFKSFCSSNTSVKNFEREVFLCKLNFYQDFIYVDIEANGFLYNMVRIIVGTLLEVGRGKIHYEDIKRIIDARNRNLAGPTAPAKGLCLEKVDY